MWSWFNPYPKPRPMSSPYSTLHSVIKLPVDYWRWPVVYVWCSAGYIWWPVDYVWCSAGYVWWLADSVRWPIDYVWCSAGYVWWPVDYACWSEATGRVPLTWHLISMLKKSSLGSWASASPHRWPRLLLVILRPGRLLTLTRWSSRRRLWELTIRSNSSSVWGEVVRLGSVNIRIQIIILIIKH